MIVEIVLKTVSEANASEHWAKKHKRHRQQKNLVLWALYEHSVPKKLPVHITMTRIGGKKMDEDNLISAFKYIKDAIAEYFIPGKAAGRADDSSEMGWSYYQEKKPTPKNRHQKLIPFFPMIRISFDWPVTSR